MELLNNIYKGSFFSRRHKLSWRVPYVCNAIIKVLDPSSIIDVGCGIGDYVAGFLMNGVNAYGLEGSENCLPYLVAPKDRIIIMDFRNMNKSPGWYDLVLCLEVLEHIEEEFANATVYNFSNMSDRILTSAAPPGQKGHYHVNCQPKEYWEDKFGNYDYRRNEKIEELILKEWDPVKPKKEMSAYYNNLIYFERNLEDKNY